MSEHCQGTTIQPDDSDRTLVSDPGLISGRWDSVHVDASRDTQALLDIHPHSSSAELASRLHEGMRQLLHARLMLVSACLIAVMIVITMITAVNIDLMPGSIPLRAVAVILLLGCMAWLHFRRHVSMASLRRIELIIFAVPVIEMVLLQAFRTEMQLTLGRPEIIPLVQATVGLAACLLIAIYGIFIPSTWQRTALITTGTALLPTGGAWLQLWMNDSPSQAYVEFNYAIPVLTLCMAVIVSMGAHLVDSLRREVEVAREYGQYHLTEEIGRGGMGVVYRGEHRLLKRPAAIKLIHPESAADKAAVERFEREVQLAATLTHWNTVRIYDYGHTDHGDFYCVMELLEGRTLADLLKTKKTLSVQQTVTIVKQICDGLQEAHGRGMVHRDLKPANIFLAATGGREQVVKILDFGVATSRFLPESTDTVRLIGTPFYMSPEQIRGEPTGPTSDIYTIGCVMFECLTGDPPFRRDRMQDALEAHLSEPPPLDRLPDHPPELRAVVARCLEKDIDRRFQSVDELRAACRRLETGKEQPADR